jgi:hypothetical protein
MHEHGPLWKVQPGTQATPKLRANDTADYPWHAWLASKFGDYELPIDPPLEEDVQRFDLWLASVFLFPCKDALLMLLFIGLNSRLLLSSTKVVMRIFFFFVGLGESSVNLARCICVLDEMCKGLLYPPNEFWSR